MTLKVATFNVLNLALPGVTFYGDERYSENGFARKRDWIARQLDAMGADIVGFQEVWQETALRAVCTASAKLARAAVAAPGAGAPGPILESGPFVGIASTLPFLEEPAVTVDFPAGIDRAVDGLALPVGRFSRPVLKARLALENALAPAVTVFVAHLKSKRPLIEPAAATDDPYEDVLGKARSLIRRASEAAALRFLVLETVAETAEPVIVLGDLNDGVNAVTTEMVTGSRPFRYWPYGRKKIHWDRLLYSAWQLHAARSTKDVAFTHIYNALYDKLDHILLSEEFYPENRNAIGEVVDVRYFNDHLIDGTLSDTPPRAEVSDHGQVLAEIRLRQPAPH